MPTRLQTPIIVWFRADLRVHDNSALATAAIDAEHIIPVFIFDDSLTKGRFAGSNRNRFLLESLSDLKTSLQKRGGDLVVRHGKPEDELLKLAQETNARDVYITDDYTPMAVQRDRRVETLLQRSDIKLRRFDGKLAVSSLDTILTKSHTPYKVFTPFFKQWNAVGRSVVAPAPERISLPQIELGELPSLSALSDTAFLSPNTIRGGETEGRQHLNMFLDGPISDYHLRNNDLGIEGTSRLSAYFHFGCLSVREVETMLPNTEGARAWHRQLAWRDFYYYVLYHFPHPQLEFQAKYRQYPWETNPQLFDAWQEGKTGFPVVDAAMRQLKDEGWMHNRARLIVGSFLTKDLGIDWRHGEAHFMQWLIDGDMANNNGNWQWIASVGVDPAPVYRRLYNPSSQRDSYDPTGAYVRKYVPELAKVDDLYLSEPWKMPEEAQRQAECIIGSDYPAPIVNHKEAREVALEKYRSV